MNHNGPMVRLASAELKRLLVEAGLMLLYETGLRATASHIPMGEAIAVLERTHGLKPSMGSIFGRGRLWANVKEYQIDVLRAAVDDYAASGPTDESLILINHLEDISAAPLQDRKSMLIELCRIAGTINGYVPDDPKRRTWTLWVAIWSMAMSDKDAGEKLLPGLRAEEVHTLESFSEIYRIMLSRLGLRIKKPYEMWHLAALAAALTNGVVLRAGLDPERTSNLQTPYGDEEWNLLGVGFVALAHELIEDDPDRESA